MNKNKSIFSKKNKVPSRWMDFEKIGDKCKGTLISIENVEFQNRKQKIYELEIKENSYIKVGGKKSIDDQMKNVKIGDYVCFKFTKKIYSDIPGFSPLKQITVYSNNKKEPRIKNSTIIIAMIITAVIAIIAKVMVL